MYSIPFENLDIHYGRKIHLDYDWFYEKIVEEGRGGFCYELNGLFYYLLKNSGYKVKLISARVCSENGEYSEEYDHMAIIASLDGKDYLVDVGFGMFSLDPLPIVFEQQIEDAHGIFNFDKYDDNYIRISVLDHGELIPQYIFTVKARNLSEFKERCEYQQTSDASHFTQKKVISIPTKNGRITLNDEQIKITAGESVYEISFDEDKFEEYLERYFGIKLAWDNVAVV